MTNEYNKDIQKDNLNKIKSISKNLDKLDNQLDDIYKSVYTSNTINKYQTSRISNDIFNNINAILSSNSDIQGIPDIAQLYTRIEKKNKTDNTGYNKVVHDLIDVLGNDDVINTLMANPEINRYIKAKDLQIDMVLKYMPKLLDALSIKQDNVLSADNFNKKFLNVINKSLQGIDQSTFNTRINHLIRKYRLEDKLETIYENTSKYGEQFIYIVPYDKALKRLENKNKVNNNTNINLIGIIESVDIIFNNKIVDTNDRVSSTRDLVDEIKHCGNITLKFNPYNTLSSIVERYEIAKNNMMNNNKSLYESFVNECILKEELYSVHNKDIVGDTKVSKALKIMGDTGKPVDSDKIATNNKTTTINMDKILPDKLEYDKLYNSANDGLTLKNNSNIDIDKINPIPGALIHILPHENIIPIYIEDICLGYYYLDFQYDNTNDIDRSRMLLNNTFESLHKEDTVNSQDVLLRYIASKISDNIDTKFINANQDLKEEIYAILKYNNNFNTSYNNNIIVTFLPPQDLYHFYFKLDPITHRGISDLDKALIPAMFWVLLDLTTTMGIVSRSLDHRVIYVKQNVEQNIAKTLMNVVNQLKKGNMGIRQMQSMNNIIGMIGRYNDYIIPVGPSGDSPVSFDTIQGQQIETPKELMDKYEENAINSTDVPLELVNSVNQIDYATRYTMQNSKFLRKVMKRQAIIEDKFTNIISRIYNLEYNQNEKTIEVKLPSPVFLSSINGLAIINNVKEYVSAIADIQYPNGIEFDEKEKAEFIRLYMEQQLGTYIDLSKIEDLVEQAKLNIISTNHPINTNNNDNNDEL